MRKLFIPAFLLCGLGVGYAFAGDDLGDSSDAVTFAVYGDAPYGCKAPTSAHAPDECPDASVRPDSAAGPNPGDPRQLNATPAFVTAVNNDDAVRLIIHVGDIHSGSQFCTLAYDQTIAKLWSA